MWVQSIQTSTSMDIPTIHGAVKDLDIVPVGEGPSVSFQDTDCVNLPQPIYGRLHAQVMTDEQMEILRRQISVYATICQQLVEMHKAVVAQQNAIPVFGVRHGILYDSMMAMPGQKITARQRWTPSQVQLQILECIFDQGNGTPTKQNIKEITSQLSTHGPVSETNVYNWFQNRRARTKRKQQSGLPNNGESEMDTDLDSPKERKTKTNHNAAQESAAARQSDICFPCPEGVSDQFHLDFQQQGSAVASPSHADGKSIVNFRRITSFEHGSSAARNGQVSEPGNNFRSLHAAEGYAMRSLGSDLGTTTLGVSDSTYRHAK